MKKWTMVLSAAVLAAALLTGCSQEGDSFEKKTYTSGDQPVSAVYIDVQDRQIEVSLSPDEQVRVDYSESAKEYYDISLSEEGVLTMTAQSSKTWTDYIGAGTPAGADVISLQVPDALLSCLSLRTTKEDVTLPALSVTDSITLTNNGGDITFDTLQVGSALSVENKNGDIEGSVLGSRGEYSISCTIKKGDSNLPELEEGGEKSLQAVNNNGDINITFVSE